MKKILFKIEIDNVIDIITNSSSELFVLKADSDSIVKELLFSIYPDYLSEYAEPKQLKSLDNYELKDYIEWVNSTYGTSKENLRKFNGYKFDEIYEESNQYSYNKHISYEFKDSFFDDKDRLLKSIDPENKIWVLYSLDENPKYEYQEKLENIADRYRLG